MFVYSLSSGKTYYKYALGLRDIVGKEFHPFHEILILHEGPMRFTSETYIKVLSQTSIIIVPEGCFHQYDPLCDEANYCRSVLQFDATPEINYAYSALLQEVHVIENPSMRVLSVCQRMNELTSRDIPSSDRALLLDAYVTELLTELKYSLADDHTSQNMDMLISKALSFINIHFCENISIGDIAAHLNMSSSALSHRFRKILHISVYSYILKKKLTYANSLIRSGTPPTMAAFQCGFSEYSGFYKTYKKYFGYAPSITAKASECLP